MNFQSLKVLAVVVSSLRGSFSVSALLVRLGWIARKGQLRAHNDSVEATTLYWRLVDVIWAVLFVCIYLEGR